MPQLRVLKTVYMGKGCWMNINIDEAALDGDFGKYVMETTYDGKEDSNLLHVPPHWHKNHDEHITVLEGRLEVLVEGEKTILRAGDDPAFIPRQRLHSMRGFKGERTVLQERPTPLAREKAEFFNDLLSEGSYPGFWRMMRICYDSDTYLGLPGNFKLFEQLFILVFGFIAKRFVSPKPKIL